MVLYLLLLKGPKREQEYIASQGRTSWSVKSFTNHTSRYISLKYFFEKQTNLRVTCKFHDLSHRAETKFCKRLLGNDMADEHNANGHVNKPSGRDKGNYTLPC